MQYSDSAPPPVDPYTEAYTEAPPAAPPASSDTRDRDLPPPPARGRSRSRSPARESSYRRSSPASRKPPHAPIAPNPSNVLGVFGLSIRTVERDLDDEFSRFGRVEKVVIVYDQRQSDRSRGFGFITMSTTEEATRCIKELNGVELNGRRIRVDYSITDRPHAPTPGEYMGHRRRRGRDTYSSRDDRYDDSRDSYRDRRDRDRDPYYRRYDRDDRERDYGRDRERDRDWRDRRSPPPRSRYSPEYRRRRSYSRSPPRGSSPARGRDYDAQSSVPPAGEPRW
ncbi:hypothetical protein BDY19DRAFT_924818 [Irpex rosettiformis]|uniref:Uncharacterized protein n=1 Tax=Irpex rosettiformis TaxID=378272 RepID=A0ACB8UE47_9APHY|nr:hypothetical protein BDY19DRAFT_924818 [Irpex rosettiformis]